MISDCGQMSSWVATTRWQVRVHHIAVLSPSVKPKPLAGTYHAILTTLHTFHYCPLGSKSVPIKHLNQFPYSLHNTYLLILMSHHFLHFKQFNTLFKCKLNRIYMLYQWLTRAEMNYCIRDAKPAAHFTPQDINS